MENTIGFRLRDLRGRKSLKSFCEPLGVTPTAISNVENGHTELSMSLALKISEAYNVSLDWLVKGVEIGSAHEKRSQNDSGVFIDKDELIQLQRLALKNTIEEREIEVERLKNN